MSTTMKRPYKGVFPVVPTTFTESGALDLESQKRCVDFMIDAGSTGLAILANFSEQFALSDDEQRAANVADKLSQSAEVLVRLVAATVFKTAVRCVKRIVGGFDSHALPPY